jgi:hypothetical protein
MRWKEKNEPKRQKIFAIIPHKLKDTNEWVWLEWVYREFHPSYANDSWDYYLTGS